MKNELSGKISKNFKSATKKVIRFAVFLLVLIAVFSAGVGTGYFAKAGNLLQGLKPIITRADDKIAGDNHIVTISTIETLIESASDLVTAKFHFKDADTYENYKHFFGKKIPFTTDKTVFTYKGTLSVGIELSEVKYDIDNEKKVITLELPELKVTSNEIDDGSFDFVFKSDSIFNTTDMEDFTQLRDELKQAKKEEVMSDQEFMESAKMNAENVLRKFLTSADATKDYTVNFK